MLTITVNALSGTLDAGPHTATASIVSGPGSFVGPSTCTYTGGAATASCTVTITSAAAGTTVVSATSAIPVNGQTITRTTGTAANTAAGGSGNASRLGGCEHPDHAGLGDEPVGTNHVLTITVNAIGGTLDAGPHTATASIVSGPGCSSARRRAPTPAALQRRAAGDDHLRDGRHDGRLRDVGHPGQRPDDHADDRHGGEHGCRRLGNASKTWASAKIVIAPSATNEVGHPHTFTVTLSKDSGTGSFVPAAGEHVR